MRFSTSKISLNSIVRLNQCRSLQNRLLSYGKNESEFFSKNIFMIPEIFVGARDNHELQSFINSY
jgi:hypothetical protein